MHNANRNGKKSSRKCKGDDHDDDDRDDDDRDDDAQRVRTRGDSEGIKTKKK